ncbi:MAG: TetR/AcrR family transcriptional regulator [Spirochaetes bacterium]|nr:TetR/AcrR family transcriptional regulator [Spirochaetota bacterium]MBU1079757.1 TetR/AcrR family transcriptional regulator [Spirochaetota bacterium]
MIRSGEGSSRRESARLTRQTILEKALELFRRKGFDGTSLVSIVEAAGVSKGAFYAHFKSKSCLIPEYLAALDLDYRKFYAAMPGERDAAGMLMEYADAIARILESRLGPDLLRVVYRAEIERDIPLGPFVSRDRELYQVFRDILEAGTREGLFRPDIDIALVSDHLVMSIRGMVFEWCARGPDFDLRSELASHVALIVDGIRAGTRAYTPAASAPSP